jgi:hypothetical protein
MKTDSLGLKFFNPEEVFKLNPEMSINLIKLESGINVIQINDFYLNPELVKELILNTPVASNTPALPSGFAGYRIWSDLTIQDLDIFPTLTAIVKSAIDIPDDIISEEEYLTTKNRSLVANIYTGEPNTTNTHRKHYPHWDVWLYTALIHFTENPGCGTALFKHKKSGLTHVPTIDAQAVLAAMELNTTPEAVKELAEANYAELDSKMLNESSENYILEESADYEVIYRTEGAYNQLTLFPGSVLHSQIVNYDYLKENNTARINQVMFLNPLKRKF